MPACARGAGRGRAGPQQRHGALVPPAVSRRSPDAWASSSPVAGDAAILRSAPVSNRLLNFHGKAASLGINSSSQGSQGEYPQGWGRCSRDAPWGGVLRARPEGRRAGAMEFPLRVCVTCGTMRGLPGGSLESGVGGVSASLSLPPPPAVTVCSPEEERKGEKIYLYTHLKQQPIW